MIKSAEIQRLVPTRPLAALFHNLKSLSSLCSFEGLLESSPGFIKHFFSFATEHKFILHINIRMPTIAGILTLMSGIND